MHRTTLFALLAIPVGTSAQAQVPVRYRMVTTSPRLWMASGANKALHMISISRTNSVVTMTRRDTVGGTVVQLRVESTFSMHELTDSSKAALDRFNADKAREARSAPSPSTGTPLSGPPPSVYTIFLRNGVPRVLTSARWEQPPVSVTLDSLHPFEQLNATIPGLALLIPNPAVPVDVGSQLSSRFFFYDPAVEGKAAGKLSGEIVERRESMTAHFDTTLTAWTRKSVDTLEAKISAEYARRAPSYTTTGHSNGTYLISYDARREITEVLVNNTSTQSTLTEIGPGTPSTNSSSWRITRIP